LERPTLTKFRADAESQFQAVIEKACSNQSIRAIAEEFCVEELANRNVTASIGEQVAERIRIPHRYCDLNNKERLARGVFNTKTSSEQMDGFKIGTRIESIVRLGPLI
jgi:hypothetical protein